MICIKININKVNTLNNQLRTFVDDYELFIIIIILISSSIIIGEEFNKGTIKQLLIKPFNRKKILLSKYITCIIMILLTFFFIFIANLIIGGILFDIDSLKNGVVVYNHNTLKTIKINIFMYILLKIIAKLPMYLIITGTSILLGIILNSTIGSFSITMLIYTFSEVINKIIITYNLKFMSYFITLNWNLNDYLFGGLSKYQYLDLKKSVLTFIIYDIIIIEFMFNIFDKKNIRNI